MSRETNHAVEETEHLVDRLRQTLASSGDCAAIPVLQTHISWIVFSGEDVYKIKKPVDLGFLDFSSLERRHHFCIEEVRLNRRLAPDFYVGVVAITIDESGTVAVDAAGRTAEYAVHMRRLPATGMMDACLEAGEIDNARLHGLAKCLATFHARAPTGSGVDAYGTPASVRDLMLANFEETRPWVAHPDEPAPTLCLVGAPLHDHLRRWTERELQRLEEVMARRMSEGRIRDGHGDLHSGNICFVDDDVVAYDCIEFSPALRCGDVACDLAFLAMDLDRQSFRAMSAYLVASYARLAGDETLHEVLRLYKTYRAMVRAKVGVFRADQLRMAGASAASEDSLSESRAYLHLAATYTLRPALILTCGLPASGKSYTARHLATTFEAALIRNDVVRKQLFGLRPEERVPDDRKDDVYGARGNELTTEAVLAKAGPWLASRRPVVVDAVFGRRETRDAFVELARQLDVPLLMVEVRCPEDVTLERLAARKLDVEEVSDAGVEVYRKMRDTFEAPDEIEHRIVLDGRSAALDQVEIVLATLSRIAPR